MLTSASSDTHERTHTRTHTYAHTHTHNTTQLGSEDFGLSHRNCSFSLEKGHNILESTHVANVCMVKLHSHSHSYSHTQTRRDKTHLNCPLLSSISCSIQLSRGVCEVVHEVFSDQTLPCRRHSTGRDLCHKFIHPGTHFLQIRSAKHHQFVHVHVKLSVVISMTRASHSLKSQNRPDL